MLIERYGDAQLLEHLRRKSGARLLFPPGAYEARVCEIYRICYETKSADRLSVVADFAAHFPNLVSSGRSWIAQLSSRRGLDPGQEASLFLALASGFRRAANVSHRFKKESRIARLLAAYYVRHELQEKLTRFLKESPTSQDEFGRTWFTEEVNKEVKNLIKRFPSLSAVSDRIADCLLHRQAHKASVLAAARIFNIRMRDLQSKPY